MLLLASALAVAASPTITLPEGAGPEWLELARRAGFDVVTDSSTANVHVVTEPAWALLVRRTDGAVRVVGVDAPFGPEEREDLVFLAASLVRPVTGDEEWTDAPSRAAQTAAPSRTTAPSRTAEPSRTDAPSRADAPPRTTAPSRTDATVTTKPRARTAPPRSPASPPPLPSATLSTTPAVIPGISMDRPVTQPPGTEAVAESAIAVLTPADTTIPVVIATEYPVAVPELADRAASVVTAAETPVAEPAGRTVPVVTATKPRLEPAERTVPVATATVPAPTPPDPAVPVVPAMPTPAAPTVPVATATEPPIAAPAVLTTTEQATGAPVRPWATLTLGAGWEPAMPVAGYGALAGGIAVDWLVVGVVLSAETPRAPATLPATLDVGTAGLRAGWHHGGALNPAIAVDAGVARRHFAGDGVDPVVTLPFVALNADIGLRLGRLVLGPQARVSVDLAPVIVRVGGDPRLELSRLGVDAGIFLSYR